MFSPRFIAVTALFLAFMSINAADSLNRIPEPEMVFVEGGSFKMGDNNGLKNERPQHTVTLSNYYLAKYEVTQALWKAVMGNNPSTFSNCETCPVEQVGWPEIQLFIEKLNALTGKHYRLPTEAEWEYAAIGGKKSQGYKYPGSNNIDEVAWYKLNAGEITHTVGQKKPNELGLYDMSGNVWEICSDWYNARYYKNSSSKNPRNDKQAKHRVVRGGSWRSPWERCYNRARNRDINDHHKSNGGFRLAME